MIWLYIALFGALGSVARHAVGLWAKTALGLVFPWGTLMVNVLGSLILGFVVTLTLSGRVSEPVQLAVAIGFCGAFTTFSTFELEVMNAFLEGKSITAASYIASSLVLGLAAVWLGRVLALNI
jgi:fluoride exporter